MMWHVQFSTDNVRRGTFEQLQALAARGKIVADTKVRAPDAKTWSLASEVPGLFPEAELAPLAELDLGQIPASTTVNPLAAPSQARGSSRSAKWLWPALAGGSLVALLLVIVVVVYGFGDGGSSVAKTPPSPAASPPSVVPSIASPIAQSSAAAPPAEVPAAKVVLPLASERANLPPLAPLPKVYKDDGALDIEAFVKLMRSPTPHAAWATHLLSEDKSRGAVEAVAFSGDTKRLAAAYAPGTVVVWDVATGAKISEIEPAIQGRCRAVALNSTGKHLMIGGDAARGGVVVDADTGKKLFVHNAPTKTIVSVSFSPDDRLVTISDEGRVFYQYPVLGGRGGPVPFEGAGKAVATAGSLKCRYALLGDAQLLISGQPTLLNLLPAVQTLVLPTSPQTMQLSAGERFLLLCDKNNNLMTLAVDAPTVAWSAHMTSIPDAVALSADGRTLAFGMPDGSIQLRDFMVATEPPQRLVRRHLRDLLRNKKYAELEALAERVAGEVEPLEWFANSTPYEALISSIALGGEVPALNDGTVNSLDHWLKKLPDATWGKILRANYYIQTAWEHRGGGYANTVTPEQWKLFHENIDKAAELIKPMCEGDQAPPAAFSTLMVIAMAESWPEDQWRPAWEKIFAKAPRSYDYHRAVMQRLMPRWGGQPGDCEAYARKVGDKVGGPDGDAMYARLAVAQWLNFFKDDKALDEGGFDYARVQRGLLHVIDTKPDGVWAGHIGLRLAYGRKDQGAAKLFLGKLKGNVRHWLPGWWHHENDLVSAVRFAG